MDLAVIRNLDTVRDEISNALLMAISIFALIPLAASLTRISEIGWQVIMYLHIIAYLIISAATIFRRRIHFRYKAMLLVSIAFIVGCLSTASLGLVGTGALFLIFSVTLATIFFGIRHGIILIFGGIMVLVAVAFGVQQNRIVFDFSIETAALSFSFWVSRITAFALFSTVLIFSLGRLIDYLVESGKRLEQRTLELNTINANLNNEITDRKKAEKALRNSERKLHAIFDHHYQLTGLLDSKGKLLDANRTALRFADAVKSDVIGCYFWECPWWDPSQESDLRAAIDRAARGDFIRFETTHPTSDGEVRDIDFSLSPVIDNHGNVIYIVPEGRDITEIRRAEQERETLREQLNQAQKLEAIGTLAGGIAHDFNNILSSILGFAELVKYDLSDHEPELTANIDEVIEASLRAKDLVQHILTFSRHTDIILTTFPIPPLIMETVKFLRASLPANIEIRADLDDGGAAVSGNPSQIHQIIMNLCTNSVHAMRDKGGTLNLDLEKITLRRNDIPPFDSIESGDYLKLTVSDTGPGISAEIVDRIFDPFFTTKVRGEGTGLGLSVVHGIVKEMNGAILVRSTAPQGATFEVFLPVCEYPTEGHMLPGADLFEGKGNILVVDDDPNIALVTGSMLEKLGYTVTTKTSSSEALDLILADSETIDLVITDYGMPNMDGIELSKKILQNRPGLPIVLCTGFAEEHTLESLRQIGIHSLLMKPVIASKLSDIVKKSLELNAKGS